MKSKLTAEKLSDNTLEGVSGGAWSIVWALPSAAAYTALTAIPSVCYFAASKKRKKEAEKALQKGDVEKSKELQNESASLKKDAACLAGVSIIPGAITVAAACTWIYGVCK